MMIRRLLIPLLALASAALASGADDHRPNILFVLTDDQASFTVGALGNPQAVTPNMDRLVQGGARLTNSFVTTPVCSPSRAGLMTGRYGTELGITDWIKPGVEDKLGLPVDSVTHPQLLGAAGYRTGLIGKWHLGTQPIQHPTKFGYGYFVGFLTGGNSPKDPTLEKAGETKKFPGLTADVLTDEALEFLRAPRDKAEPFFLAVHYRAPHTAWLPVADEDMAPYRDKDFAIPNPDYPKLNVKRVKNMTRDYFASVRSVDRNLGRLLKELDDQGIAGHTVVIFTADHGYNMGHNGIWHKGNGHWVLTEPPPATKNIPKGQRPNLYDHSLRVPTLVRWPGVTKPGSEITQTVKNLDWLATLADIAGADASKAAKHHGRSFAPLLRGESPADWDNDLYAEYSTKHQSHTHMRAWRTPRYKLIRDFLNAGRDEFYDLQNDPEEHTNLIGSDDPAIKQAIADLDAKLRAKMKAIGDEVAG